MCKKSNRGRKKKFENLVKINLRIEEKTVQNLNEIAKLLNKLKGKNSITFSDVARKLLDRRCELLCKFLEEELNKNKVYEGEISNAAIEIDENGKIPWGDFFK